jgi:hypothetical protein
MATFTAIHPPYFLSHDTPAEAAFGVILISVTGAVNDFVPGLRFSISTQVTLSPRFRELFFPLAFSMPFI